MTEDRARGDWDRTEWKGEREPGDPTDRPDLSTADSTSADRWTKSQWPGDQGAGTPSPEDPDAMPEGENALSGDRHTSGESHFARGQATENDRT
jgi:hypothetical protein